MAVPKLNLMTQAYFTVVVAYIIRGFSSCKREEKMWNFPWGGGVINAYFHLFSYYLKTLEIDKKNTLKQTFFCLSCGQALNLMLS